MKLVRTTAATCPHDGSNADEVDVLPEGALIGDYEVVRPLGEGGMGVVYEVTHRVINRRAALKILRAEFASNRNVVIRFLQEAKAVNVIDHEHIIDIYDYSEDGDGFAYFVMEYLEGESLEALVDRERPLPLAKTLHVFEQVMQALAAAHAKNIVHRDLKPDNVYLARRGDDDAFVKLLDFGIAKLRGDDAVAGLTRAGSVMGTPQYMSPEQALGKAVDHRSDVFSLGVMLYRAAVGKLPFEGDALAVILKSIIQDEPTPPLEAALDPDAVPERLARMIRRAMEKNPADRYQSVEEMLVEVRAMRAALPVAPSRDAVSTRVDRRYPETEPVGKSPSRGPLIAAVAGLAALALGGVLALGTGDDPSETVDEDPSAGTVAAAAPAEAPGAPAAPAAFDDARKSARRALESDIASGDVSAELAVAEALDFTATARAADVLYAALEGPPRLRLQAAGVLRDLKMPEAAPRLRAAMAASGDRLRVDLAACLVALGDRDGVSILEDALDGDPRGALVAAAALAKIERGDRAEPVLRRIYEQTPPGRDRWRMAAEGLAALGDDAARGALSRELAQSDPTRSVGAAAILARLDDDRATDYLARVAGDESFGARGAAALALARLGRDEGLEFVATGLDGAEARDRLHALGTAAHLAGKGGERHARRIAAMATDDSQEPAVRAGARAALLAFRSWGDRE